MERWRWWDDRGNLNEAGGGGGRRGRGTLSSFNYTVLKRSDLIKI